MSKSWSGAHSLLDQGIRGLTVDDVTPETRIILNRLDFDRARTRPLVMPIYHASTYIVDSVQHYLDILKEGGHIYQRLGNPTVEEAECGVNVFEEGAASMLFSSGMAAMTTVLTTYLGTGDHVIAQNPIYSGTHKWLTKFAPKYNIDVTLIPAGSSVDEYKKHIRPNTKMLVGETPCNPMMTILDLDEFGKLGHRLDNVITVVDSTFASPYIQKPIKHGIDIVMHSGTKYIGGHSDLIAGVLTTRTKKQWTELNIYRTTLGNTLSPYEANLLTRGLKTLAVRMDRHSANAQKIAEFLESQAKVARVYYPGLQSHPAYDVAKKQMSQFGGMISFEMKTLEAAKTLVENLRVIQLAVSLGGVESLVEHPATMTHGPMIMGDAERKEACISDGLIRFSVGLEDADDIIKDLQQALDKVKDE